MCLLYSTIVHQSPLTIKYIYIFFLTLQTISLAPVPKQLHNTQPHFSTQQKSQTIRPSSFNMNEKENNDTATIQQKIHYETSLTIDHLLFQHIPPRSASYASSTCRPRVMTLILVHFTFLIKK